MRKSLYVLSFFAFSCMGVDAECGKNADVNAGSSDSITVTGIMPGYEHEPGRYVTVTFDFPHNLMQRGIHNHGNSSRMVYLDEDGSFAFSMPLDRRVLANVFVHPTWRLGKGFYMDVSPGDSVHLVLDEDRLMPDERETKGSIICQEAFEADRYGLIRSATDSMSAEAFVDIIQEVVRESSQSVCDADRAYNAILAVDLMTWYRWFDEKRHVSVMDVEAPSAFRLVQGVLPSDNELVASNVYYCTVISHSIAREILLRARQPSARNTLEAAMDTVCRLCEDTNTGHLSMLGQSVMVHLLESCYGYAEERDSLQVSKEQLFTYPLLRDEWNKAFATMDVESADRVLCASLLQNEKVAAIRKSRRSKYVQLVFIKNDEYVANRMFHLDNLRRDFRKSKDLTFVYCPIVEADSDRLVFEKYQKMYPEEDYVMFSMEDYVQMLNAIASPYKTLDVTMDKSGHVLLVPLNPEDEFHFRYLLRRMLEKDKERK